MGRFEYGSSAGLLRLLAINLVPVIGVVVFDWTLSVVVVFYWLEAGIALLFDAFEGLFAEKPLASELYLLPFHELRSKRGGVRLISWLPPIHPRNLPFVLVVLQGIVIVWPAAGVGLYVLGADVFTTGNGNMVLSVLAAGLMTVFVRAMELAEYLREDRYARESAQSVIDPGRVIGLIAVVFLGMLLWSTTAALDGSALVLVLAALIGTRVTFELAGVIAGSIDGEHSRIAALREWFGTDNIGTESEIEVPDGTPIARFRPDRNAVRVRGLVRGVGKSVNPEIPVLLLGLGLLVGWLLWGIPGAIAISSVIVSLFALVTVVVEELLYGYLEYRVYEDAVVAYDRLLDEPQWRISTDEITDSKSRSSLIERLATDTGTVQIMRRDRNPVLLICLPDSDCAADTFQGLIR